ncbi:hypothetical protein [Hufsiella ginkgonis]|uniref:Lipocalin-like domain-containing protein n=1 Tax=Hufsiella ginkgonis TaxID=2695274 RepID=A0A7K1Y1T9_9SPHI|nr:hypothetical protein [Hufsiella ginkgonis]MXV17204.1 hypothetical protein [Hufsiella ginkgonis]
MKALLNTIALVAFASVTAFGQQANKKPIEKGTWVVESNVKTPKIQTIKIYDESLRLVYQETVNKKLNIKKAGTRARLDAMTAKVLNEPGAPGTYTAALWK